MSTKQILIDARKSASVPGKLTSGRLVRKKEDGTMCYCALGHIALAAGFKVNEDNVNFIDGDGDDDGHPRFEGIDQYYSQLEELHAVTTLAMAFSKLEDENFTIATDFIYELNDNMVRHGRHDYIIEAFDEAIKLCKD